MSNERKDLMQNVTFKNRTWDVAATLRLPEGFDANQQYPAIVCAHPISSCKEQTSGAIYGEALTQAGFITLAFDASTQGASGGEPRFSEDPATRVEDFRCAVDYLVTLPYVDADKVVIAPDCGLKYLPRDVAFGKMQAMAEGARILRAEHA